VEEINEELNMEMPVISNLIIEDLTVFPNPNQGLFNIRFELPGREDVQINIFNSSGQLIKEMNLVDFEDYFEQRFDLGSNPAGTYFLMIRQGEEVITRKI
jgi:hypothetical protein